MTMHISNEDYDKFDAAYAKKKRQIDRMFEANAERITIGGARTLKGRGKWPANIPFPTPGDVSDSAIAWVKRMFEHDMKGEAEYAYAKRINRSRKKNKKMKGPKTHLNAADLAQAFESTINTTIYTTVEEMSYYNMRKAISKAGMNEQLRKALNHQRIDMSNFQYISGSKPKGVKESWIAAATRNGKTFRARIDLVYDPDDPERYVWSIYRVDETGSPVEIRKAFKPELTSVSAAGTGMFGQWKTVSR
jgi:hypothetical protein